MFSAFKELTVGLRRSVYVLCAVNMQCEAMWESSEGHLLLPSHPIVHRRTQQLSSVEKLLTLTSLSPSPYSTSHSMLSYRDCDFSLVQSWADAHTRQEHPLPVTTASKVLAQPSLPGSLP